MIVRTAFPGDDDDTTKWFQHDCYGEALGVLVCTSRDAMRSAYLLTGQPVPLHLEHDATRDSFDHRAAQDAHDHLAAYWRWHSGRVHPSLPFDDARRGQIVLRWLNWLREQVSEWPSQNRVLTQLVVRAVAGENTSDGYAAEDALIAALRESYPLPN